jgi:SAM-dependent MidA family methyltransferase
VRADSPVIAGKPNTSMIPSPTRPIDRNLPSPDAEAREHSARVRAYIADAIAATNGWISFADYMNAALYAPGLGYYVAGTQKLGADGDFVTAPELSRLFGGALATQLAQVLRHEQGGAIIELGPGTGRLSGDVLSALQRLGALPSKYLLLEVSPNLRERQKRHLAATVPEAIGVVEWIDVLPRQWRGAVIANEVVDAVPPHLVARSGDVWLERGVSIDAGGRFVFADRAIADNGLRKAAAERLAPIEHYVTEINLAAEALIRTLAQRCERGAMFIIDYGFPAAEYYHAQRDAGTLMAHYRHHATSDLFLFPGLADLTAHVDFSAMARAAVAGGMVVAGYTTQAHFLINNGILDALLGVGDPQSTAYLREAARAQTLLSPAEMGELFKVLAVTRGLEADLIGFRDGDRTHRL